MRSSLRSVSLLSAMLLAGTALAIQPASAAANSMSNMSSMKSEAPASAKLVATRQALRKLWHGHIVAVRKVVVAAIAGNATAEKAAEGEVVANAHAIADSITPFYGKAASDKLFTLLAGHYGAVKEYLEASIAKDTAKQSKATNDLNSNADEIASFLSGANPNLPKATVLELLQIHASHHISQIQELIAKDKAAEAKTWKEMSAHMNVIADAIADALAKQFPSKF